MDSDAQIKIKSEVAINNQQANELKILVLLLQTKIDSIQHPNLDKQVIRQVNINF